MIQDYLFPGNVNEAVTLLAQKPGLAKIFAGGTSLLLDGKEMAGDPEYFVDLSKIEELDGISEKNGFIFVGANTTLAQCAVHPLILKNAPALALASGNLGSTQIRNVATVAGNVVGAKPFADAAVILTALEAICVVRSKEGNREVAMADMFARLGESAVDSGAEFITHIKFPARKPGEGNAYERLELRNALSYPLVNVAVNLGLNKKAITKASIVAAPLAPGPRRISAAEQFLIGRHPTEESFAQAGQLANENVKFSNSPQTCRAKKTDKCLYDTCRYFLNPVQCSAEYRHQVLPVLVRRALITAAGIAVQDCRC